MIVDTMFEGNVGFVRVVFGGRDLNNEDFAKHEYCNSVMFGMLDNILDFSGEEKEAQMKCNRSCTYPRLFGSSFKYVCKSIGSLS